MAKKAVTLAADLVTVKTPKVPTTTARKGSAIPAAGIEQREPVGTKVYAQLNLKVDPDWYREFSVYAAQTDRGKKELMEAAFEALKEKENLR